MGGAEGAIRMRTVEALKISRRFAETSNPRWASRLPGGWLPLLCLLLANPIALLLAQDVYMGTFDSRVATINSSQKCDDKPESGSTSNVTLTASSTSVQPDATKLACAWGSMTGAAFNFEAPSGPLMGMLNDLSGTTFVKASFRSATMAIVPASLTYTGANVRAERRVGLATVNVDNRTSLVRGGECETQGFANDSKRFTQQPGTAAFNVSATCMAVGLLIDQSSIRREGSRVVSFKASHQNQGGFGMSIGEDTSGPGAYQFNNAIFVKTTYLFQLATTPPAGPDQISFIDDTFSPPLNQLFQAGQPTGPITVKVAYSLNSLPSAVVVLLAAFRDNPTTVAVQRGNGVISITLNSIFIPADAPRQEVLTRLAESSAATAKILSKDDVRAYLVAPDPSKDAIQISNSAPAPGSSVPTSPQDISATCLPQLKSGSTRFFALRIFDPDSPNNALLGTSDFMRGTDQQASALKIPGFSVKPDDVRLGRIALKCVLYDASQSQVVAESGSYLFAINSSASGNPAITPGGVGDAARGGAVVARGGLASIYGTNLAASTTKPGVVPVSTYLGGVQVSVGGRYAPIMFISPKQINFQVPFETPVSSGVPVIVTRDGVASSPVNVTVADYAPAVFVYGNAPDPIAVHANGSLITAANPAAAGEVIVVYGTGVGKLSPFEPETGDSPIITARATLTPTVTVGGSNAPVLFAGLTSGFVGLAQFNIQLPNPLPGGGSLPLVISFGSASSQPVNIAVR